MNTVIILALGFWLASGDWAAIEVRKVHGKTPGLVLWLAVVFAPLVGSVFMFGWKVSLGAAILATVISGAAYWCKRQDALGSRASRLFMML